MFIYKSVFGNNKKSFIWHDMHVKSASINQFFHHEFSDVISLFISCAQKFPPVSVGYNYRHAAVAINIGTLYMISCLTSYYLRI